MTVQVEISPSQLWQTIQQLSWQEQNALSESLLHLKNDPFIQHETEREKTLMRQIFIDLPLDLQVRFDLLVAKRENEGLNEEETEEYLELTEQQFLLGQVRAKALAKLAKLKQTSASEILTQHHIQPRRSHVA